MVYCMAEPCMVVITVQPGFVVRRIQGTGSGIL